MRIMGSWTWLLSFSFFLSGITLPKSNSNPENIADNDANTNGGVNVNEQTTNQSSN
jgi:hypothetical protein